MTKASNTPRESRRTGGRIKFIPWTPEQVRDRMDEVAAKREAAKPSASEIADQASGAYLARLQTGQHVPTYAPDYGSGEDGANPFPPESREADLYNYSWGWAHSAETDGRTVALDHPDAVGVYVGTCAEIFALAKEQTLRQFGMID